MAIDPKVPQSRRAILAASLAGVAGLATKAALAPTQTLATDGEAVLLGMTNFGTVTTAIQDTVGSYDLFYLYSAGGAALRSMSNTGAGIVAQSNLGTGIAATSLHDNGVHASSGNGAKSGLWAENTAGGYGVSGSTGGSTAAGVWGSNAGGGQGVRGTSVSGVGVRGTAKTGVGVHAQADPGAVALRVDGRVQFQRSGRVKVNAGQSSVLVTLAGVTTASYVIATLQANVAGLYVRGVVPAAGSFRIYLSKAVASTVYVGYLVVN
jgi:hypothetical protein